jgi:hypothetical protein
MRKLSNLFAEKVKRGIRRLRSTRRGSVLIIVVALLVMMALIGTAAISMARLDRYAATQQVTTVENEIIREAMLQQARNDAMIALSRDNTGTMDSPYVYNTGTNLMRVDQYLSARTPLISTDPSRTDITAVTPLVGGDPTIACFWPALTKATPAVSTTQFASGYKPFESPWGFNSGTWGQCLYSDFDNDDPSITPRTSQRWIPGSVTVQYSATYPDTTMQNKTRVFPAFYGLYKPDGTGTYSVVLAGDADGDGIADGGTFRLTDTPIRGEHFYATIKIVDNNSAINPQIAWSRDRDYDANGNIITPNPNFGFFGGNVGFEEMLEDKPDNTFVNGVARDFDPSESKLNGTNTALMAQYNNYRFNTGTTYLGAGSIAVTVPDSINPAPVARKDYAFDSQTEAKDNGLDRRLKSPTYNSNALSSGTFQPYQALPASDATAFAYKFNFVNPTGSPGQLAQFLQNSLLYSAPNFTVDPDKAWRFYPANPMDAGNTYNVWWNEMDFSANATTAGAGKYKTQDSKPRTIRQYLQTLNPTLDQPPVKQVAIFDWNGDGAANNTDPPYPGMLPNTLTNSGTWTSGTPYRIDNIVKDNDTNTPFFSYISVYGDLSTGNNSGHDPMTAASMEAAPDFWEYQPYVSGNARTSVNTATFREIFRSYYNVMAEGSTNNNIPQAIWGTGGGTTTFTGWVQTNEGSVPPDYFNPSLYLDMYNPFYGREFNKGDTVNFEPKRPNGAPYPTPYDESRLRMFGSPIRDVRGGEDAIAGGAAPRLFNSSTNKSLRLNPSQVMVLRSALAAINLVGMRDQGIVVGGVVVTNNVLSRTITLYDTPTQTAPVAATPAPLPRFQATVFSTARQPFITEVLAYNLKDPGTLPAGYVAIELYNPYPIPLNIGGWQIATLDRRNPTTSAMTPPATRYPPVGTVVTGQNNTTVNPPPDDGANMVYRPLTVGASGVGIPANTTIPANGYVVLENYSPTAFAADSATEAKVRPPLAVVPPGAGDVYISNLSEVMADPTTTGANAVTGSEFVLLRPRRGDGLPTKSEDWYGNGHIPVYDKFDEGSATAPNLADWVPIDSYDFSGMELSGTTTTGMNRLHYIRASYDPTKAAATQGAQWRCVYPGRYNGNQYQARQQGTEISLENVDFTAGTESVTPSHAITLGSGDRYSSFELGLVTPPATSPDFPTAQNFTIPLCDLDWPGYNPLINVEVSPAVLNPQPYKWPYGGFARTGDIMKVPFIGAYVLREVEQSTAGTYPPGMPDPGQLLGAKFGATNPAPNANPPRMITNPNEYLLEVNPVTMDSVFAEDSSTFQNETEDVGRFCPRGANMTLVVSDYYSWASDLFDYFTVTHNQSDDYMPNFSPLQYWRLTGVYPQRVGNDGATPDNATEGGEDTVATQGLININTAPADVLDMVPMVLDPATGKVKEPDNRRLADAIVAYRSNTADLTKGPFKTLFDLNKVADPAVASPVPTTPGFQNAWGNIDFTSTGTDPGDGQGDYSPYDPTASANNLMVGGQPVTTDGVRNDFEERYLQISRLSNLLTTRSDSFNVYVLVQSWKNIGAGSNIPPMLTWEKRIAFTADRSSLDPTSKARIITTTDIPAD